MALYLHSIHITLLYAQKISFIFTLRSSLFRDVTQRGLVISYRSFGNFFELLDPSIWDGSLSL